MAKRKDCPFPGCTGGCTHCANATQRAKEVKAYVVAFDAHHKAVTDEAFPKPRHDQESDVGHLMKRMLINRLVRDSFNAGWVAAGKVVPTKAELE